MKCMNPEKHDTCQHRAWNGNKEKLCGIHSVTFGCPYESKYIRFDDIPDDTIMYSGDIERTGDFRTKAEWIKEFGKDFRKEYDEPWFTASVATSEISLQDLVDYVSERDENYEDWAEDVYRDAEKDPIVVAGIKRLNEILAGCPTYWEDQEVVFEEEES